MHETSASGTISVIVNGEAVNVPASSTVIGALSHLTMITRRSVRGSSRGPLCGMGICQECRVRIDDQSHCLACQTACQEGMHIDTCESSA